jgi:hypothetical protein
MTFVSIRCRAFSSLPAQEFLKLLAAAKDSSEDPDVSLLQQRSSSSRVPIDDRAAVRRMFKPNKPVLGVLAHSLKCYLLVFQVTSSNLVPTQLHMTSIFHLVLISVELLWLAGRWVYVLFPKSPVYRVNYFTVLRYLPIPLKNLFEIKLNLGSLSPKSQSLLSVLYALCSILIHALRSILYVKKIDGSIEEG